MIIKNLKFTLFPVVAFEYRALEQYLEKMALKGWKLQGIKHNCLRFASMEPRRIKYSVAMMEDMCFFDEDNNDKALEFREYCISAGWSFLCQINKVQIYYNENDEENIPIYTEDKEKFRITFRASLRYVLENIFAIIFVLASQYMIKEAGLVGFLAQKRSIVVLTLLILVTTANIVQVVTFFIWAVVGRKSLKDNIPVRYVGYDLVRFSVSLVKIAILFFVFGIAVTGKTIFIRFLLDVFILEQLSHQVIKFINRTSIRRKQGLKRATFLITTMITIIIGVAIILTGVTDFNETTVDNNKVILKLEDFYDTPVPGENTYVNQEKSILASFMYYSGKGSKLELNYDLYQSPYQWILESQFNTRIKRLKKKGFVIDEYKERTLENVNIYVDKTANKFYLVSKDKFMELSYIPDMTDRNQLLDIAYAKVFK